MRRVLSFGNSRPVGGKIQQAIGVVRRHEDSLFRARRDLANDWCRIADFRRVIAWAFENLQVPIKLCITQEQLEQIRQLRGVPEPEQLQERKNND
jgi:hypothetical protein